MNTLLKDWNIVRIIRLIAGLAIIFVSISDNQIILSIIGLLLVIQAALNSGCGANGCAMPVNRKQTRRRH
ncbi:hypothetical protein [Emticicia sp. 17c]|uniref:hypothetical protein n=1 Tax=Emticicia sp. 17c TaxID=3127704 RepID=UPI00301DFDEC